MDKRLSVNLIVQSDSKLIAIDNSNYNDLGIDLLQHVMLEFLTYNTETSPLSKTIRIKKEIHNRGYYLDRFSSEFLLDVDGTYSYYKLVIPTLDHFKNENDLYNQLDNELFVYDKTLYKSNISETDEGYNLSYVLEHSEKITNYLDAYNFVQDGNASQTFYCPKKNIFSVCNLQRCLVSLQKKLLIINCKANNFENCATDITDRNRRDFLLSALYVFDYLKDIGNFTEAQRILDNLSTCNSICGDELDHTNNICGCGNSI